MKKCNSRFYFVLLLAAISCELTTDVVGAAERLEASTEETAQQNNLLFFVAANKDKEIYAYALDASEGSLRLLKRTSVNGSPGAMCSDPSGRYLYVALMPTGSIASYKIASQSQLVSTGETQVGAVASYLNLHPSGTFLLSAYYSAGQVAVHKVNKDGSLLETPIQVMPTDEKAHGITLAPSGGFAFVPHTRPNVIFQLKFDDQSGMLSPNKPGKLQRDQNTGPRHLWFHPNGKYVYSSDEQGSSVTAYEYNQSNGLLNQRESLSSLPEEGFDGKNTCSDIEVHPSGKFLFVANRGHDTIAGFSIDSDTGKLKPLGHTLTEEKTRSFNISPDGHFLVAAGQASNNLAVFRVQDSGKLERLDTIPTGKRPHWVQFVQH